MNLCFSSARIESVPISSHLIVTLYAQFCLKGFKNQNNLRRQPAFLFHRLLHSCYAYFFLSNTNVTLTGYRWFLSYDEFRVYKHWQPLNWHRFRPQPARSSYFRSSSTLKLDTKWLKAILSKKKYLLANKLMIQNKKAVLPLLNYYKHVIQNNKEQKQRAL